MAAVLRSSCPWQASDDDGGGLILIIQDGGTVLLEGDLEISICILPAVTPGSYQTDMT